MPPRWSTFSLPDHPGRRYLQDDHRFDPEGQQKACISRSECRALEVRLSRQPLRGAPFGDSRRAARQRLVPALRCLAPVTDGSPRETSPVFR